MSYSARLLMATAPLVLLLQSSVCWGQFPDINFGPVRVGVGPQGQPSFGLDLSSGSSQYPSRQRTRPAPQFCPPQEVVRPAPRRVSTPVRTETPPAPTSTKEIESIASMTKRNKIYTPEQQAALAMAKVAEDAKQAFQSRNFETALNGVNQILEQNPENADALQFRSLVHFAAANYPAAAADAYDALAFGPLWSKEAIDALYSSGINYRGDLRRLERKADEEPNTLAHRFLTAYHALVQGDLEQGEIELTKMLALAPEEPVATQLLAVVRQQRAGGNKAVAKQ